MKFVQIVIVAIIASLATLAGAKYANMGGAKTPTSDQPTFERVMATHTLRCAYSIWTPFIMVDPNTKQLRGIDYDLVEQMGRILGMKIVWNEEVPMSEIPDNLKSGRNDIQCLTVWPSGNRAPWLDLTMAVDYIGAYAFVRADDTRFDGDLAKLNDPGMTISVIDGDYTQAIANEDFPKAKQHSLTMDSDGSQLLMEVTTRKADAAFTDPFLAYDFEKNNPGTLKQVPGIGPVRVFGDSFAVAKGETKLRDMLNVALNQMNQSGFIRATLDKYLGTHKGLYFYPAKPWEQ